MNVRSQINLNSLITAVAGIIVSAVIAFGIRKLDENNSELIRLTIEMKEVRVQLKEVVITRREFLDEMKKRDDQIDDLRRKLKK